MKKQAGLTLISWVIILGLVATQVIMAIRIFPVYMNHSAVVSVMDRLPESSDVKGQTARKIMSIFRKRLKIENLYDLASDKEAFTLKKIEGGYTLIAHYESRGPIFKNLEFVATFDHQVDIFNK